MKPSLLIFMFSLVSAVYCAVRIDPTVISDAERAKGFSCRSPIPELGLMRAGEHRTDYIPDHCFKAICSSNGYVTTYSCGSVSVRDGCKLVEEISKPYPKCCPTAIC